MTKENDVLNDSSATHVWEKLAAELPPQAISWRQDGKVVTRDGRHSARFVCYIEAGTVRERLDSVVPGEWDLTIELLPQSVSAGGEVEEDSACAFKARLQILGVLREDVGYGRDYKAASTDAFKRAAVRFGIGHELYNMEQLWVEMDGDGKYAKPVEDPNVAYARKFGGGASSSIGRALPTGGAGSSPAAPSTNSNHNLNTPAQVADALEAEPPCPKCGGRVWNNKLTKKNPKAPDYKCRSRSCDGVIWPTREDDPPSRSQDEDRGSDDGYLAALANDPDSELPF